MAGALAGLRVVEAGEGKALAYGGKLLRGLGAEVIKVEPPGGDALRAYGPFPGNEPNPEHSGLFIFMNGGKRGTRLDLETAEAREGLTALLEDADVLLHSFQPAKAKRLGLEPDGLLDRYPRLIVSAITPYGSTGPYAEWKGYAIQAQAGSTVAYRNGEPDREPITSPLDQAEIQHGGVHIATATVLALLHRRQTGRGQFVDVGVMEAVRFAVAGTTTIRVVYAGAEPPARAGRRFTTHLWGLVSTRDGDFDFIVLLDRQWRAVIEIMGNPEWSKNPRFASVEAWRDEALTEDERNQLLSLIEPWFAQRTTAEIWELMRRARISCQPAHSVPDVVESDHMKERNFFVPAPGQHPPLRVPGPPYRMSVTPWEPPAAPPALGDPPASGWTSAPADLPEPREDAGSLPLEGVRVIDLGQVWAGPLLGRYLADYGADVILVDTESRPRAISQTFDAAAPITWESIHRNRRSVQLDLRTPKGVELFKRLLSTADVMIDNFTPRALANLGLKYEELAAENPRLIIAALSAAGRSGPWMGMLSYGPSLTALFGVKSLYGYPEEGVMLEDASDLDPIAGTTGALAIMAALHHRDRTGKGQMIEIAQGEVGFIAMTEAMIEHIWNGRDMGRVGNQHRVLAPHGIYPCSGEDRWIAIACGSDEEWSALARAAGHPEWLEQAAYRTAAGRRSARTELDSEIGAWTRSGEPETLTRQLQEAGVAAMPAMRVFDFLADPHYRHRREDFFELHEDVPMDDLLDGNSWHLSEARPRLRMPVPEPGQHNEEVFGELLGLSAAEVRSLQAEGVIA